MIRQMQLSIVTIHLNDFDGLERTSCSVKRVLGQPNIEWVIVDGGSDCVETPQRRILDAAFNMANHHISGRDNGIYDAMNKGTRLATGNYVLFLNAGDELHEEFEPESVSTLLDKFQPDMLMGRCVECYENGQEVQLKTRSPAWTWYGMPASHPAILFSRQLLGEAPYDTRFRIAADYDLISRLVSSGGSVHRIPMCFARFYLGGISDSSHTDTLREEHEIRVRYFPVPRFLSAVIQVIKSGLKKLAVLAWFRRLWRRWV